jgi:hypothetical protein
MINTTTNVRNYLKLELLIARSHVILRQLFKTRYSLFNGGKIWNDSSTYGSSYCTTVVAKNKNINLTAIQKTSVSNRNSNEWDLTTLTALLLNSGRPRTSVFNRISKHSVRVHVAKPKILFSECTS